MTSDKQQPIWFKLFDESVYPGGFIISAFDFNADHFLPLLEDKIDFAVPFPPIKKFNLCSSDTIQEMCTDGRLDQPLGERLGFFIASVKFKPELGIMVERPAKKFVHFRKRPMG